MLGNNVSHEGTHKHKFENQKLGINGLQQKKHLDLVILVFIIIISGFFIFGGANWGLPTLLHSDEGTVVNPAIKMVKNRSFEPDVFFRPDHLLIQINCLAYRFIILIMGVPLDSINQMDVGIFYLTARIITGVFALGSIVLAYLIGKRQSNFIGLTSAFLFAFFLYI